MSGAITAAAIATTVATGYNIYQGERQKSEQKKANRRAERQAREQANLAEQDANRADRRMADSSALLGSAAQRARGGVGSTMLTGAQGIDPSALSLGQNTLLGG